MTRLSNLTDKIQSKVSRVPTSAYVIAGAFGLIALTAMDPVAAQGVDFCSDASGSEFTSFAANIIDLSILLGVGGGAILSIYYHAMDAVKQGGRADYSDKRNTALAATISTPFLAYFLQVLLVNILGFGVGCIFPF